MESLSCLNEQQFLAKERTMLYARISGPSPEGNFADVICKLDPVYLRNSNQLSSSKLAGYTRGDVISFRFDVKDSGNRHIKDVQLITDELDLRDIMADWMTMIWEESRILKD